MARTGAAGIVIGGTTGVGKTRLAGELLARASTMGARTAWVQATRSAATIPFGAFAHLLPSGVSGAGPVNLLRRAGEAVTSDESDRRLVLGVDDAHLLDPSSATLVRHLCEVATCFTLVTVRTGEPTPDAIVSLWKEGLLERIELQTLSQGEVAELLAAAVGSRVAGETLHRLWDVSRGNPLFLHELVVGAAEAGTLTRERGVWRWRAPVATPRLAELVDGRLAGLSTTERNVLEIVAHSEPVEASVLDMLTERTDREAVERRRLLDVVEVSDGRWCECPTRCTPKPSAPPRRHQPCDRSATGWPRRWRPVVHGTKGICCASPHGGSRPAMHQSRSCSWQPPRVRWSCATSASPNVWPMQRWRPTTASKPGSCSPRP